VSAFFTELKLEKYTAAVVENEVDGHMLKELVAADGLSELGVTKLHAIKIKCALKVAADDLAQTSCAPVGADDDSGPSKASSRRAHRRRLLHAPCAYSGACIDRSWAFTPAHLLRVRDKALYAVGL
jgi:hypothetical protein